MIYVRFDRTTVQRLFGQSGCPYASCGYQGSAGMVERPFPPRVPARRRRRSKRRLPDWPDWVYYLIAALLVLLTVPMYARIFAALT